MKELRHQVKELGTMLGQSVAVSEGAAYLELIEQVRLAAKSFVAGDEPALAPLMEKIAAMKDPELLIIARAFSQFLNLANIAEQNFTVSDEARPLIARPDPFAELRGQFGKGRWDKDQFAAALQTLDINLVLTAHPTEITRRTLIHKHREIAAELRSGIPDDPSRIEELIAQDWHTNSIRRIRPTPLDEASWGQAVIEDSLWDAVPVFLRRLDKESEAICGDPLPPDARPVRIGSWMGGERDGNPHVTAAVTRKVLAATRATAAGLYMGDLEQLSMELSMAEATPALLDELPDDLKNSEHPYREIIRPLRRLLAATREQLADPESPATAPVFGKSADLLGPLMLCYDSLKELYPDRIANGYLLDVIRRVRCFGVGLVRLDIRQHAERHIDVMTALTTELGLGDYGEWDEVTRQKFLLEELDNRRPLIPDDWQPDEAVAEVLDTIRVIADTPAELLGIYIISMAGQPSDVLLVQLLQKACGVRHPLPVAPLFETLDDLDRAGGVMTALFDMPRYTKDLQGHQHVMIGYSDSAKDAGVLAASWAQYRAQDDLIKLCRSRNIRLTLFHGRGGALGRGGGPAHDAILSQPPGSVAGGLRVTEQGETIRYKFGMPDLAVRSLSLYASAILEATLSPPPEPKPAWQQLMNKMADTACTTYRGHVRDDPDFVSWFRQVTPEVELGQLPLASRPSRRKTSGGIESLRAIPWIFAWTQNRLLLPGWLGFGSALAGALEDGDGPVLKEMQAAWPFFRSRLALIEMVYSKANAGISGLYDRRLGHKDHAELGRSLRQQLIRDTETLLNFLGHEHLLQEDEWGQQSLEIRQRYLVPLHLLQIELLARARAKGDSNELSDCNRALMVTMAGISAGMRNTG